MPKKHEKDNALKGFLKISNAVATLPNKTFSRVEHKVLVAVIERLSIQLGTQEIWDNPESNVSFREYIAQNFTDESRFGVRFTYKELRTLCGSVDKRNKKYYYEMSKGLVDKSWADLTFADGSEMHLAIFSGVKNSPKDKEIVYYVSPLVFAVCFDPEKKFVRLSLKESQALKSNFAFLLFIDLLGHRPDERTEWNWKHTTRQLKDIFNMSAEDYMRLDKRTGKESFDRTNFERACILAPLEEIRKKTSLEVWVKKIYSDNAERGRKVWGYEFICKKHGNNFLSSTYKAPEGSLESEKEKRKRKKNETEQNLPWLMPTEQDRRDFAKLNQADYDPSDIAMSDPAPENDFSSFAKSDYEYEEY